MPLFAGQQLSLPNGRWIARFGQPGSWVINCPISVQMNEPNRLRPNLKP